MRVSQSLKLPDKVERDEPWPTKSRLMQLRSKRNLINSTLRCTENQL